MNRGMKLIQILLSIGILNGPIAGALAFAEEAAPAPNESRTPAPADKPPVPSRPGKLTNIKGVVTEVDPGSNSIKVREGAKEGNKEYTVGLNDKTIITAGKIRKMISEVKPGDKVVARVLNEDGKITARSVRLSHEGRKATKEPAPESKAPGGMGTTDKPAEAPEISQDKTPALSNEPEGAPKAGE